MLTIIGCLKSHHFLICFLFRTWLYYLAFVCFSWSFQLPFLATELFSWQKNNVSPSYFQTALSSHLCVRKVRYIVLFPQVLFELRCSLPEPLSFRSNLAILPLGSQSRGHPRTSLCFSLLESSVSAFHTFIFYITGACC